MIPLSVPHISGKEWEYVKECLDTEWISSVGPYVDLFEERIKNYTGASFAVACVNGTAALHTALLVLGVQPGGEVIVPTMTFIAPVNVVRYIQAEPVFMDCDDFYNIDPEKTVDFIQNETEYKNGSTINKKTGKRIAAIIPVHVFGNAVDLNRLYTVCKERSIAILEDASESLGTFYRSGPLSSAHTGTIGHVGCFSFNGNKIITTGGGGMIVTNSPDLAEKAKHLTTQAKTDPVYYIHDQIGYNYRLTNIQAALGVAQLEQLDTFKKIKQSNYAAYKENIDLIDGLSLSTVPPYADNNHWMYPLRVEESLYGKNRDGLMNRLADNQIQSRPVWHLNHTQPPYRNCQSYRIEKATHLFDVTLNIPCSVGLKEEEMFSVIDALSSKG
ncbi:MAG: LegC family aminotransferase [Acidobacteriota bacterium]